MTEAEFLNQDPKNYPSGDGTDKGSALLFYTAGGTTNGGDIIRGISIDFDSLGDYNIQSEALAVTSIFFQLKTIHIHATVTERVRRPSWMFYRFEPINLSDLRDSPTIADQMDPMLQAPGGQSVYYYNSSSFIFTPLVDSTFNNSDDNPLISNATLLKKSKYIRRVNRSENAIIPTNYTAIMNNTAALAEVQDSNYTDSGWTNARYEGSLLKPTEVSLNYQAYGLPYPMNNVPVFDEVPSMVLNSFPAEIFSLDADDTDGAITNKAKSEREVVTLYFRNVDVLAQQGGGPLGGNLVNTPVRPENSKIPKVNDIVYIEQKSKLVRVTSRKIYALETATILTTTEIGSVLP